VDDALRAYLTSTLEPAQRDYNEHYVCDYPLGLAGVEQYRAQHDSLVRIDLERYAARLEQAQRDCKDRFRKDILFRMKDDIFNARRQFRELNKVMEQLTYGEEVYRFELEPSRDPQLAAFYQVIVDKGNQQMTDGDSLDNLAATADPVYERQVDALMEKIMADVDENTRARQEGRTTSGATLSDYVDYRTYLDYDIKVTNTVSGQQAYLSRVSRDSSGGENQAPFYVAICASLLQIYQKSENSIRLVLLDEAFSKMTSDRIRPMMELFRRLQLQVLLISTVEKSTAIQPYCDITYSIERTAMPTPLRRSTGPAPLPMPRKRRLNMNNTLANIWLFATHWTKLDAFDTEEELNDELELLQRQSLPTKVRQVTDKEGREQFLLYVKQADRDYARYCTGWRPGGMM